MVGDKKGKIDQEQKMFLVSLDWVKLLKLLNQKEKIFITMMLAGLVLTLLIGFISWKNIIFFIFGRRGKYGINTSIIFLVSLSLIIILNSLLFWLSGRPDSPEWIRIDTTATKQFILEDQAIKVIGNLNEDVKITVFMATGEEMEGLTQEQIEELIQNSPDLETKESDENQEMTETPNQELLENLMKELKNRDVDNTSFSGGEPTHVDEDGGPLEAKEPDTFTYDEWDFRDVEYKPNIF